MRRLLSGSVAKVVAGGLLSISVALAVASPAGARTASGQFTFKPGQTLHITNMALTSADAADGVSVATCIAGTLTCQNFYWLDPTTTTTVYPPSQTETNSGSSALTWTLTLFDGNYAYESDGSTYEYGEAGWTLVPSASHALVGYLKGKLYVTINDASSNPNSASVPSALGSGAFTAMVTIDKKST